LRSKKIKETNQEGNSLPDLDVNARI